MALVGAVTAFFAASVELVLETTSSAWSPVRPAHTARLHVRCLRRHGALCRRHLPLFTRLVPAQERCCFWAQARSSTPMHHERRDSARKMGGLAQELRRPDLKLYGDAYGSGTLSLTGRHPLRPGGFAGFYSQRMPSASGRLRRYIPPTTTLLLAVGRGGIHDGLYAWR
mgnify:CR=1 FL=1